jgi:ABC-type lipoprotein export system ATPase subunit
VLELLLTLNQREGATLVLVTHDPHFRPGAGRLRYAARWQLIRMGNRFRRTAFKIAWRESRASSAKFCS